MLELKEEWRPIKGAKAPAARAIVEEDHSGLTITLVTSEMVNGPESDLRLSFGRVLAYSVYEEFLHPWGLVEGAPKLSGPWGMYTYPVLQIENSRWVASLPNLLLLHPDIINYRVITLDQIVDVLCNVPPEMTWTDREKR